MIAVFDLFAQHRPSSNLTKALFIFVLLSGVYFFARSPGLDDYDSVQFAMGVRSFDIWQHQPHPPGYPLYIWSGQLGAKMFGASPDNSLKFVSAVGAALFVSMWFSIARGQFNERFAWWLAGCLAITAIVWLTATKVWTDPLAIGLLSAEILAALDFVRRGGTGPLVFAGLLGAAASGTRPQMILVCSVVLVTALRQRRPGAKLSVLAMAVLLGGCLLWLLPLSYLQWRLRPDQSPWLVYPKLLYSQWIWRLDQPNAYIGAGGWSLRYLAIRVGSHFGGWFGVGFGLLSSPIVFAVGTVVVGAGLVLYLFPPHQPQDRQFWQFHWPWAITHILTIFAFLPASQRYYLIIYPLLLVAILRGYLQLKYPLNRLAWAVPLFLLLVLIPAAIENHTQDAPRIKLSHYLASLHPPSDRSNIVLLFVHAQRHAEWYAPGFVRLKQMPPAPELPEILNHARLTMTNSFCLLAGSALSWQAIRPRLLSIGKITRCAFIASNGRPADRESRIENRKSSRRKSDARFSGGIRALFFIALAGLG